MWYTKVKKQWILLFVIAISTNFGCTEEESDIDLFYGRWEVRDIFQTIKDGIPGPSFSQFYILELEPGNRGTKYTLEGEETAYIKWLFNEGKTRDDYYFLLSTQSSETESLFQLGTDHLYFVGKYSPEEMLLTRSNNVIENDTLYRTIWNLVMTKQ